MAIIQLEINGKLIPTLNNLSAMKNKTNKDYLKEIVEEILLREFKLDAIRKIDASNLDELIRYTDPINSVSEAIKNEKIALENQV